MASPGRVAALSVVLLVLGVGQALAAEAAPAISALKDMCLQTALVTNGQAACLIAAPEGQGLEGTAEAVQAAVKAACGVTLPIKPASQITDADRQTKHLIAIGNFATNRVAEDLYLRQFTPCDFAFPGGDGADLRTVHNPWQTGKNVLCVAGSSVAGTQAAVQRLGELLARTGGQTLGPLHVTVGGKPPAEVSAEEQARLLKSVEGATYSEIGARGIGWGTQYYLYGVPSYARLFLAAMRTLDKVVERQGAADDLRSTQTLVQLWDAIEEGEAFSDADRLELTNIFARYAYAVPYARQTVKPSAAPHGNNWNAVGSFFAGLYFARYYPGLPIGEKILKNLDVYYQNDLVNWKVSEDCPGYGNITVYDNYTFALNRPNRAYFDSGSLKTLADYDILITNNVGNAGGFGDTSQLGGKYTVEALKLAAWLYRDGRYLWWYEHLGGGPGTYWVPPEVLPRQEPTDMLGVKVMPLAQWVYDRGGKRAMPLERCFDKISLRETFDPQREYLLLGGMCYGFHSHPSANVIINYSDRGRVFLFDDGYMIPELTEHSTLTINRDGFSAPTPELAELTARADWPGVGLVQSRLVGYNGLTWDRNLIWVKDRYMIVLDDLLAEQAGTYDLQCIWRTLGDTELGGNRWTARQGGETFHLVNADGAALSEKSCQGPANARALYQAKSAQLQPGDHRMFANAFHVARPQQVVDVRALDSSSVLVKDQGVALVGLRQAEGLAGLSVQAALLHVTGDELRLAGATQVEYGGVKLAANLPVDAHLNLRTGQATVVCQEPTTVTLGGKAEMLAAGRHDLRFAPAAAAVCQKLDQALSRRYAELARKAPEKTAGGDGQGLRPLWAFRGFDAVINCAPQKETKVTSSVAPLTPRDVDYGVGELDAVRAANGNVMFATGKPVVLSFDLGRPADLTRVTVNSRQLVTFQGGCGVKKLSVEVSNDGFRQDRRLLGEVSISKPLENNLVPYPIAAPTALRARTVRISAEPYTEKHKVYFDSVEIWGLGGAAEIVKSGFHLKALVAADLNGDGKMEALTGGTDRALRAIGADGRLLWKTPLPDQVLDVAAGDINGDGQVEVIAGCADHTLYARKADGSELWTVKPPARSYERPGYRGVPPFTGPLRVVFTADLEGDGKQEVLVGSGNWWGYCFDGTGQLRWSGCNWAHQPTCGVAYDLDGDGKREVAMGNTYAGAQVWDWQGKEAGYLNATGHAGPTALAAGDLTGNGKGTVVMGDRAGWLQFLEWKGRQLPSYQIGSEITSLALSDLNGDGKLETVAGAKNYLLYGFDSEGKLLWHRNLLDVPRQVKAADMNGDGKPELLVAGEDRTVRVLGARGDDLASFRGEGWMRQVTPAELDGNPATRELLATCDDGAVYALQMK
ncbi:hypothetical protein LLH23_21960 [bacterium]|nr:hypothetical protein [bacterium]